MKRSKAYRKAAELVDRDQLYTPLEAVTLAKQTATTKFDATVEVAMRLGVDPRKADQMVRGTVNLPHGTGKTARVIVFATGDEGRRGRGRRRRHGRQRRPDRPRSRTAGSTSTPRSPRRTRWPRSAGSPGSSARAA